MEISGQTGSVPHLSTSLLPISLWEISPSTPCKEPSTDRTSREVEVGHDIRRDKPSRHPGHQSFRLSWLRAFPSRWQLNETIDTPIGSLIGVPASWKALTYPYS